MDPFAAQTVHRFARIISVKYFVIFSPKMIYIINIINKAVRSPSYNYSLSPYNHALFKKYYGMTHYKCRLSQIYTK